MRLGALLALVLLGSGCGPAAREVPSAPVHEDPAAHIRRIATSWQENSVDEGFLDNDPKKVAFFRVSSRVVIELGGDGRTRQRITREELFRMTDGREFHCLTEGAVEGAARYRRERDEVRVELENRAGSLPRNCREPGFPVLSKDVPAANVIFALRSERLVAVAPPQLRAVLLPAN